MKTDSMDARWQTIKRWRSILGMAAIGFLIAGTANGYQSKPGGGLETLRLRHMELYEQGKYDEAVALTKRRCKSLERQLRGPSGELATCLGDLAQAYQRKGDYQEAASCLERALTIREKWLKSEPLDIAQSLNDLGVLYYEQGRYDEAAPLYERALTIREKWQGAEHADIAQSLNNLAALHLARGDYDEAEALFVRALAIRRMLLPPDHLDISTSLNNIGSLFNARGEYEEAQRLYEEALSIRRRTLDPSDPDVAVVLDNLAGTHMERGNHNDAERLYREALAIREKALDHNHPDVARNLSNLALVLEAQGEHDQARGRHERALAIWEKKLGADHPDVVKSLNNLAMVIKNQGEIDEAKALLERALKIAERTFGPEHLLAAVTLHNLATIDESRGEYDRADARQERALAIFEKKLGAEHPHFARTLGNLAGVYRARGEYEKAKTHYERALNILQRALGSEHPDVGLALGNLAALHLQLDHIDPAIDLYRRSLSIQQKHMDRTLLFAEERRRLDYAKKMGNLFHIVLSLHLQVAPAYLPAAKLALTMLLRRKGLVLDLGTRTVDSIRRSLPKEHHYLIDELSHSRARYAHLTAYAPGRRPLKDLVNQLALIQDEQDRLWREISRRSHNAEASSVPITISRIQQALPPDGVLVELTRYFPKTPDMSPTTWGAPRYAAYLVYPDRFDWVDLGPIETIDAEVTAFRRSVLLQQANSSELYDSVMGPIVERVGRVRRLFIAPDGNLNLVPFAALYDGERYLVERYDLFTLTTGRDLLRPWDTGRNENNVVVIAANPMGSDLPGTELEAEFLGRLFPQAHTILRASVTEAELQRQTRPWLMHLAMHGFFDVDRLRGTFRHAIIDHLETIPDDMKPLVDSRRVDDPMLQSGLLLATGPDDADIADGRLTAYEISGWDLRGTELVVLSACDTGMGDTRSGDGVFGLRRAFTTAGAQTQVMSLWKVGDRTTAELMGSYYRKLLLGKGRAEAMQETQLEMLHSEEHGHPRDWASFVVVGEWRPLSKQRMPEPGEPPAIEATGCGCQRSSVGGDEQPSGLLLLGLMGLLVRRRSDRVVLASGSRLEHFHDVG